MLGVDFPSPSVLGSLLVFLEEVPAEFPVEFVVKAPLVVVVLQETVLTIVVTHSGLGQLVVLGLHEV